MDAHIGQRVVAFAKTFLGEPYSYRNFNCWHFIGTVYAECGVSMPRGTPIKPIIDFSDPNTIGELVFLRRKTDTRKLSHTHIAIYIGDGRVIHCTFYLGKAVVISTLEDIFAVYDIVEQPRFAIRVGGN